MELFGNEWFLFVIGTMRGGIYMAQISVNNLTFGYEESFDYVFENVSFSIDTNWKLGLSGESACTRKQRSFTRVRREINGN